MAGAYASAMSLTFAAQLTAVATLALAVLALATAVLALLAWRKQSKEVTDQAEMLDLQRRQLAEQEKMSAEQAKVLGLQAEDLRKSISERERFRKAAERAQADEIGFRMTVTRFPDIADEDGGHDFAVLPGETVHMAIVSNGSRRPIKNVQQCNLGDVSDANLFPKTYSDLAVLAGRMAAVDTPDRGDLRLIDLVQRSRVLRILPGEEYGFVFERNSHYDLALSNVTASFTDDADLRWQIDRTQHLEPETDSE